MDQDVAAPALLGLTFWCEQADDERVRDYVRMAGSGWGC